MYFNNIASEQKIHPVDMTRCDETVQQLESKLLYTQCPAIERSPCDEERVLAATIEQRDSARSASNTERKYRFEEIEPYQNHWDYLKGKASVVHYEVLCEYICTAWNTEWTTSKNVPRGFDNMIKTPHGHRVFWKDSASHFVLECGGDTINQLSGEQQVHFLLSLAGMGFLATRIDTNIDDYRGHAASPEQINHWVRHEGTKRICRYHSTDYRESDTGATFYAGRRKGPGTMVRIYDKHGPIRYEAEFKGKDYAHDAFKLLVEGAKNGVDGLTAAIVSSVTGAISFKDNEHENSSEDKISDFWQQVLHGTKAAPYRIKSKPRQSTLTNTNLWVEKALPRVLARYYHSNSHVNPSALRQLIDEGEKRMTAEDWALIRQQKRSLGYIEKDGKVLLRPAYLERLWSPSQPSLKSQDIYAKTVAYVNDASNQQFWSEQDEALACRLRKDRL
jgi:hypothetical protein